MKRIAVLCIGAGLIYPSSSWAVSFKEFPRFCSLALEAIRTKEVPTKDVLPLANLEMHFDREPVVDYDPIKLASGNHTILNQEAISLFETLSLDSRAYLLTNHAEYFNVNQLIWISEKSWFRAEGIPNRKKMTAMKEAVTKQIQRFEEMVQAGDFFDRSIGKKYTLRFRGEDFDKYNVDSSLMMIFQQATLLRHGDIYHFVQAEKGYTTSIFNTIAEEIDALTLTDREQALSKKTEMEKLDYIRNFTPLIEGKNAYLEFLILHHQSELSRSQFLRLIENYQDVKREHIKLVLPEENYKVYSELPAPESWNFYGEILRAAHIFKFSPQQIEKLWKFFKPDILTMAKLIESQGHPEKFLKNPKNENLENLKKRYGGIMTKIWAYGVLESKMDRLPPALEWSDDET